MTPDPKAAAAAKTIAPFGAWASPFAIERMVQAGDSLPARELVALDGTRWWLDGRPDEGGRQVLSRRDPDGTVVRLTPERFNARTRVHEYGGGALLAGRDASGSEIVLVSDFASGRLHRVIGPGALDALTPERRWRFADGTLDPLHARALYVREDHEPATLERHGEAINAIVAVDLATGHVTPLVDGADFYAAPRLSTDGRTLSFVEWQHPNMPWDGTELRVAPVAEDGSIGPVRTIAGSPTEWVTQPRWSPDGILHFLAEDTGWTNLYRFHDGTVEPVALLDAEIGGPEWQFGVSRYGFLPDGDVVFAARAAGRDRLYRIRPGSDPRSATEIETPFVEIPVLAVDGWSVSVRAVTRSEPPVIADVDPSTGAVTVFDRSRGVADDPRDLSVGRLVEFPTARGRTAFGIFYAPHNERFAGREGERPPLIVTSHGGPTSAALVGYSMLPQFFASRGFAVLDVDYGGSTGYGRDYRKRLEGEWGVVDVEDCVAGARWLAEEGLADGSRVAIRGGSASGYTTLCALTFTDAFDAGVSRFGIGDLETFIAQTHKFESRYLDRLVGPYATARQVYHDRSPLNFTDRISCPVLILQGLEDRVVPPAQAEQIVAALAERGVPHAYVPFPGEDHGFRSRDAIVRAYEAELSFYGQVFGFEPADRIEPLEVAHLDQWRANTPRASG